MACSNTGNSMNNQHQLDTIPRCSPPPTITTTNDVEVATIPTTSSSIGMTNIPATVSKQNDLLSRISSFLPQIHAANIELCNIQQQQQNENESNQSIQIDQSLLLPVDDDDDDDDDNDTGDDEDSDNDDDEDDAIDDDDNDDNQLSHPCKRIKKESTIVMDLHLNQSTNNPFFQALYDDTTSTNDDNDSHDDNDNDEYQEED